MSESTTNPIGQQVAESLSRLWWLPLLRGILLIILGGYALFRPGMTAAAFAQVIGIFVILDGILTILAGIVGETPSRGWTFARGALELLIGAFVFGYPAVVAGAATTVVLYLIAFGLIIGGVLEIIAAVRDRQAIEGAGWLIFSGALAILFGLLLLAAPLSFGQLIIRVLGVYAILNGIALIVFAFRVRSLPKSLSKRLV